jgi:hypothetical protein
LQDLSSTAIPLDLLETIVTASEAVSWGEKFRSDAPAEVAPAQSTTSGHAPRMFDGFLTPWSRLRPLAETDLPVIYESEVGSPWRLSGHAPDMGTFVNALAANVMLQLVITRPDGAEPLGYVGAYNEDRDNGYAYLITASLTQPTSPVFWDGVLSFIGHLFGNFSFRKLYFESDQDQLVALMRTMTPDFLQEEACLREHSFYASRFHDRVTMALHRSSWAADEGRSRPALR